MKVTYLFGILAACALSIGCVAQAGTEDPGSNAQDLSTSTVVAADQQQVSPRERLLVAPRVTEVRALQPVQQVHTLQGLAGTDPGAPVQDDGDGKEPDPHPWHMDSTITATH